MIDCYSKLEQLNLVQDYNLLMYYNDFIVDILKTADLKKWSSERIDFKEKDKRKAESSKYDIFYFREHGYANTINKSLYKHMIFSLISDYNIYISDAIECAFKNHFGTAFTLLRKPLKDDLLLIEMMYVKGKRFVSKFLKNSIADFAIDRISKNDKKIIMRKCCKKINFFTANRLYKLRYSKSSKESLEKIWNKTSHIITLSKNYKTEDGNLNMIFATEDIVDENIVYFYKVCTSIQLYFITLILNILKDENLIDDNCFNINLQNIFFAYASTLEDGVPDEIIKEFNFVCKKCKNNINIDKETFDVNYQTADYSYKCDKCGNIEHIESFIS